jgi:predicted amidohydrolase
MRVALAVPRVVADCRINLATMQQMIAAAAHAGAQLIVFSEAAVTGFVNIGDPASDLALGQSIPGPATIALSQAAREQQIWVAFGLFERDGAQLHDTALLLASDGSIRLHYRRIDPHWHHWHSRVGSTLPYTQGTQLECIAAPIGTCAFLLCGDLFNATCQQRLARLQPDWLLFPMARGFDSEVADAAQWQAQDRYYYVQEAQKAKVNMLLVNQLADIEPRFHYFGGALVVSKHGAILAEHPLGQEGLLVADIGEM